MCFFTFIEVSCKGRSEEESDLFDLYAFSLYTDLKRRFFNFSYHAKILSVDHGGNIFYKEQEGKNA